MRLLTKFFLVFILLSFSNANSKIPVIFGGFSFGSILPKDTYSNTIFKENGGLLFINKKLVEETKKLNNDSFSINFDLLKDGVGEENQNVIVLALDNEYINHITIPGDNLTRTDIILNFLKTLNIGL